MKGIWAAVLTPIDEHDSPDAGCALPYYRVLLQRGCDGIAVLGTTGEAMSFSVEQRVRYMEAIASSDLPIHRMMAGTGAASLADAVRLTRAAFAHGFKAALVMPPFFFRDAGDDGILAFFDALFSQVNPPASGVLLYNFPRMSGITFHLALVERLLTAFPQVIAGIKDSSNDARLQVELLARHPQLRVFPGSERDLLDAKRRGAAGCISGSVALWPELAAAVYAGENENDAAELARRRDSLGALPFIPAVRYLVARECGSEQWERAMAPHMPLTAKERCAEAPQGECG
ncbi:MAG: dihydrodipicolinate synthase family protein [Candidatus Eremiobacteraeota bacterium]|nr:dihydrodipicolinate synthase family protein [Candidatus Eremiobacteraeota bacterium]